LPSEAAYIYQPGEKPLEELTVGALIERAAKQWPNREAVLALHQDVRLSFSDLLLRADRLAAGLRKIGLNRSDCIGIWSPNYYQWILSYLAGARLGLIVAGINPFFCESELKFCLEKIEAKAVFAPGSYRDHKYAETLRALKGQGSSLEHIIIFDDDHIT
jgi:acyl-CoA synthetase (AMP-forming)/AMP-acid ligase II